MGPTGQGRVWQGLTLQCRSTYLPDPLTDERINFGVVVVGDGEVHTRFVRRWRRIGSFGHGDVSFLREFAQVLTSADPSQLILPGARAELNEELLARAAASWINTIQVTPPRASTRPAKELIEDIARRFLRESQPKQRRGRDRRAAVALAAHRMEDALGEAGGKKAQKLFKRDVKVKGNIEEHEFDLGAGNGTVVLGVLGLSFESQSASDGLRNLHAAAWTIDDTKTANPELPLAVVMLPPKTRSNAYDRALHVFDALEVEPVPEDQVDEWAPKAAQAVFQDSLSLKG